jgi:hypothetical protein
LDAVNAVKALPSLDEINALTSQANQAEAKVRAEEITELLKEAYPLYSNILDGTQLSFFTGDYDGTDYQTILTEAMEAMKPVKEHFGIVTTVTGIALISKPTKLTYTDGDTIDFSGLRLKVTYDDGSTAYVTANDCTFSTTTANKSNPRIVVYYDNYTKYFYLTVNTATSDTPSTSTPTTPSGGDSSSSSSETSSSSESSVETSTKKKGCGGELAASSVALIALLPACGYVVCRLFRKKSD